MIAVLIKMICVQAIGPWAVDSSASVGDERLKPQGLRGFDVFFGLGQPGAIAPSRELRHSSLFSWPVLPHIYIFKLDKKVARLLN